MYYSKSISKIEDLIKNTIDECEELTELVYLANDIKELVNSVSSKKWVELSGKTEEK